MSPFRGGDGSTHLDEGLDMSATTTPRSPKRPPAASKTKRVGTVTTRDSAAPVFTRRATDEEREPGAKIELGKATAVMKEPDGDASKGPTRKTLEALTSEIHRELEAAASLQARSMAHYIAAGERLIEVKARQQHGAWLKWLDENFDLSEDTAEIYMKLARNAERVRNSTSIRKGLEAIATAAEPRRREKKGPTEWGMYRGEFLHRAVRDAAEIAAVSEAAIRLAPEKDRARMTAEREVMEREVRAFLDRPWPVTTEPHPTLDDGLEG
jgi:hypothetical protein